MVSEETALQVAITAFPIIALVATYSVDSIVDEDPLWYRAAVLALGLSALATVAPAIYTGIAGGFTDIKTNELLINLAESVTFVVGLTILVMFKETFVGIEDQRDKLIVLLGVLTFMLVMFQLILPWAESL